jgi:PAP2 superfamily
MYQAKLNVAKRVALAAMLLGAPALEARADAILDWNVRSDALIAESKLGTPPAIRVMALVQTAAYDAVRAAARGYPAVARTPDPVRSASIDAAVAAAHRATLVKLIPSQQKPVEKAYQEALAAIPDGPAKTAGIAAGEHAAAALLGQRANEAAAMEEPYRPHAQPGSYVPTVTPAVPHWPQRKPWLMTSPAQFRPGPPPALTSPVWTRDYNEVKAYGGKVSAKRSAEQTEIARFWEYSLPAIYHGVVRSAAAMPGRDITQNARLFAAVAQAMDDAMIGVFDAKYHYNFWRPATAIRNGDLDGNDATERDASWTPFIDNPLHPEYPSAHAILASAVATVLQAESGDAPVPELTTTSPSAKGVTRRWQSAVAFAREVAEARVYEGVHYRTSTEIGAAMGRRIGELAALKFLSPSASAEAPTLQDLSPMVSQTDAAAGELTHKVSYTD